MNGWKIRIHYLLNIDVCGIRFQSNEERLIETLKSVQSSEMSY